MVEPGAKLKNWNKTQRLARLLSPLARGLAIFFEIDLVKWCRQNNEKATTVSMIMMGWLSTS